MPSSNQIAAIAAAMGDAARVNMLMALRYDGVLTATELAGVANIAASTASEHLAKLMASGLVTQQKAGRRRLYTLSDGEVCDLVDGLAALAGKRNDGAIAQSALPQGIRHARLCLDHLGGELGCRMTNAMFDTGMLHHGATGPTLTAKGDAWLATLGVETKTPTDGLRCPLRLCHDWTESAFHLGGGMAGALLLALQRHDWLRSQRGQAAVVLTPRGVSGLRADLGLDLRVPRH